MTQETPQEHDEHGEIRDAMAKLCAQFPGEYWRKLDREMAYPSAFVDALTQAGYLSVLIPEEYGGAGLKLSAATAILEEIQRAGCNGGPPPPTDVPHGHADVARQRGAEEAVAATHRQRRAAAAGVRRHRADQRHRHLVAEDFREA